MTTTTRTHHLPPPAPHHVIYVERPSRGLAYAAITLGVVGCIFGLVPLLALIAIPCGILAVIFGLSGARKVRRSGGGRLMATAGWLLGLVAIALGVIGLVIVNQAVDQFEDDMEQIFEQPNP